MTSGWFHDVSFVSSLARYGYMRAHMPHAENEKAKGGHIGSRGA
jgi:hypothetical protein